MSIKTWQDVLLEIVETDPADFTDRENVCISPKDLGGILRAALQERDAEIVKLMDVNRTLVAKANRQNLHDARQAETIAAQRKVLEQALGALVSIPTADSDCDEQTQREDDAIQEAITAIQEVLK